MFLYTYSQTNHSWMNFNFIKYSAKYDFSTCNIWKKKWSPFMLQQNKQRYHSMPLSKVEKNFLVWWSTYASMTFWTFNSTVYIVGIFLILTFCYTKLLFYQNKESLCGEHLTGDWRRHSLVFSTEVKS